MKTATLKYPSADGKTAIRALISNENLSAVASGHMAQVLRVGNAFSMPHVIVRAHHKTAFYKEFREMAVAHDVLRHSVHDLNDAPNV